MPQGIKKVLAFTLLTISLLLSAAGALAEVTITDEIKEQTADDLVISFTYPKFSSSDKQLAEALNTAITQPCAELYQAMKSAQEARFADWGEREALLYKQEDFRDELRCDYGVITNSDSLVQVLVTHCEWIARSARNPWKATAYCFDVAQKRLLAPADLFEDDAYAVYSALTVGAQLVLNTVEGAYPNASITIDENASFILAGGALSFVLDPYVASNDFIELTVPLEGLGLTLKPAYAGL